MRQIYQLNNQYIITNIDKIVTMRLIQQPNKQ